MVEMWDGLFCDLNDSLDPELISDQPYDAWELMHEELEKVWEPLTDIVTKGGIVAINVGNATRSAGGSFKQFPNNTKISETFHELGFEELPQLIWQKPTNSATSFMGSGQLPPNQYPTLEHEHILLFRNGDQRNFEPNDPTRYESAYFFEERNNWFSDQWTDIPGRRQSLDVDESVRERSAAFPLEIPYRLIHMFSVYGDVVFDPFVGTGTTTIAGIVSGRNTIGIEYDVDIVETIPGQYDELPELSRKQINDRIMDHLEYTEERRQNDSELKYEAHNYPFKVTSQQEQHIQFYHVDQIEFQSQFQNGQTPIHKAVATHEEFTKRIPTKLTEYT